MTTKDGTDVMTPAEAAKYLKVSIKAVCRMARAKKLPHLDRQARALLQNIGNTFWQGRARFPVMTG